ncbi:Aldose epimerase family [Candidatus Sulfotelmatomonas gaucii]|uniref:Aldose epimerase family n=1 Tax=Candidatus Sulfuritelmatomonas gaucii TaxID=2043161 RepID=A0A2N9LW39_9BACT|nr:Aldose epimerase family [Candidatus Sulfotelmatomonas gaucii]
MDTTSDAVDSAGGVRVNQIGTMKNQPHLTRIRLALLSISVALLANYPARTAAQAANAQAKAAPLQIGGLAPVTLKRAATSKGDKPEFLSLTFLPGLGMNVFQITANIPGKGEIHILTSPSLEELARRLSGSSNGMGASFGTAFLIPYPNRTFGELSTDGTTLTTEWHGHKLALPAIPRFRNPAASPSSKGVVMHGLIFKDHGQDLYTKAIADGQTATAVIHAGSFGGHWLSETDLHFTFTLTGNAVDEKITATNIGHEDEPMAIGAHPYFAIPSEDRAQARLVIPAEKIAGITSYQEEMPTGELKPVSGTFFDYRAAEGVPLDDHSLDDNFSHLLRTHGAVEVKLIDPKAHYGIDVEGVSPTIKTVQVYSPLGKNFVAVEDQFNFIDPFGKEWKGMDTGMVTLHPSQSTTWELRLRLLTPADSSN